MINSGLIWKNRRTNGTDKGWKCPGLGKRALKTKLKKGLNLSEIVKKGVQTKIKLGIKTGLNSEQVKKSWETRRKNGTDKNFGGWKNPGKGYKIWEARRKNGNVSNQKSWITRRKNGTEKPTEETKLKMRILRKGRKLTEKHKDSLREVALKKHIESGHCWSVGKHETQLLNEQEIKDNCKIQRQFRIGKYIADGYCPETNTVYEVYEKYHDKQVFEDLDRETAICNKLSCDFIIIWE